MILKASVVVRGRDRRNVAELPAGHRSPMPDAPTLPSFSLGWLKPTLQGFMSIGLFAT